MTLLKTRTTHANGAQANGPQANGAQANGASHKTAPKAHPSGPSVRRDCALVDFMRAMVIARPFNAERFHVLFVDKAGSYLGDAPMGLGSSGALSLRMRGLFTKALMHGAHGILIAHNHPSGQCRPSQADIVSTRRLEAVATALDIELLDHLIFTKDAVYSMRAGVVHEFKTRQSVVSR